MSATTTTTLAKIKLTANSKSHCRFGLQVFHHDNLRDTHKQVIVDQHKYNQLPY